MNLRFVEAYHWAVTLKSVTRAAEKLHLTQSALSSRIAALEDELGVLLLDRRDKVFRLTTAGVRFARHAERLLNLQREIRAELGSAGTGVRAAALRVGVIESVLHSWLVAWVQALRREQPGLQLELTVETTPVLMDLMRRGALDLIVAALPADGDGVRSRALAPMPMVLTARTQSPARRRTLALAELAQEHELLTFQRGSQPHVALLDLCRRHGVETPRVHTISSISAMVELVEQGFGIATLPRAAVLRLGQQRPVSVLRCDAELLPLPIHLSWRDDPASSLAARAAESVLAHGTAGAGAAGKPARSSRKSIKA
jgi:DNA-binding transcriptional LysR family regulator